MNQIKFDLKKGTIFVPKETAEAMGSPTDLTVSYREEDESLFFDAGLPKCIINERTGQRVYPEEGTFLKCWDEIANGYWLRIYPPMMNRLTWSFPGSDDSKARGIYILDGDFPTEGCIRFDLSKARYLSPSETDDLTIDWGDYQIVPRSMFSRKPPASAVDTIVGNNRQTRHDDIRN